MLNRIRAYPMVLLLLPLVVAILFCERKGVFYPTESAVYDSLRVHMFVLTSEGKATSQCERFEAETYGGKVYVYVNKEANDEWRKANGDGLKQGDTIIAQTRIRRAEPIGDFDYRTYLLRKGIIGTAYVWKFRCQPATVSGQIPLQKRLYERLRDAGLEGDELATVGALTLGYKEDLDPELRHRFQASGAAHVLAVSGLHTGILYAVLLWLLTLGGRRKPLHEDRLGRWTLSIVVIGVMWFYAWLTGMTPSVVRAVLMVTMVEVGRMVYRQTVSVNTIAAAAVLILLARPLDLWSVSFQLSFAATFAIVVVARQLEYMLHRKEWNYSRWGQLKSLIAGTIIISLAAQIGTLPITMFYFGQVSTYFLLTNLIVLPLATFLVPCGLISLALGGSVIGVYFSKVTGFLSWTMNASVGWIERLPGSTVSAHINGLMIGIYYVLLLLFYILVVKKRD